MSESPKRKRSGKRRARRRALARALLALLAGAALALSAYHSVFVPWRASDLARKSVASLDAGNFRLAWLQLSSARQMRPDSPSVLRAAALFEGKLGQRDSLGLWEELALRADLNSDDRAKRAASAMQHGTDEQFAKSLGEIEATGDKVKAWALRIGRLSFRGDLDRAIGEARRAVAETGDPALMLGYAKLLFRRHAATGWAARTPDGMAAFEEMAAIVDRLQGTPEAQPALAFGLDYLKVPGDYTQRWIDAAFADLTPDNPALLPAAEWAVQTGRMTPADVHVKLGDGFASSPLTRRSGYSLWLSSHGLTREALDCIGKTEATKDALAFAAWAEALAADGKWQSIIDMADTATGPPESVRVLTRARAEIALGSGEKAESSIRLGLQAAAREGRLPAALGMADKLSGGSRVANDELLGLCESPGTADMAFRLLQSRLAKSAGTSALMTAYDKAKTASPDAPAVKDFGRYLELFRGGLVVDPGETAAAVAADPSYLPMRATQALLKLRRNRPAEADAAFGNITVFFDQLPPAHQAVVAAVSEANGRHSEAAAMASRIDTSVLTPGEKDLLRKICPLPGSSGALPNARSGDGASAPGHRFEAGSVEANCQT